VSIPLPIGKLAFMEARARTVPPSTWTALLDEKRRIRAGEQRFFAEKGLQQRPSRCRDCRAARLRHAGMHRPVEVEPDESSRREWFVARCAGCGRQTRLPFDPDPNRPVYCRPCLRLRQAVRT
jgi:CxxC-x17-CxxC domain-containing protein